MLEVSNKVFQIETTGQFLNVVRHCPESEVFNEHYIFNLYKSNGDLAMSCINVTSVMLEEMFLEEELKPVTFPIKRIK